nr:hypothetical protein [Sulfolobus islandicus]
MEDLSALIIMPPILFSSEAKTAIAFSNVLSEYGFVKQYGIFFEKDSISNIIRLAPELSSSLNIVDAKLKMIKGPIISGIVDYIIAKLGKLIRKVDISVNPYYTEIPLGLDIAYVIYPPSVMLYKDLLHTKYGKLRRIYLDTNIYFLKK